MKRILLSWIGDTDLRCCANKKTNNNEPGPLMATCLALQFSKGYFLYNRNKKEKKPNLGYLINPYLSWLDECIHFNYIAKHINVN